MCSVAWLIQLNSARCLITTVGTRSGTEVGRARARVANKAICQLWHRANSHDWHTESALSSAEAPRGRPKQYIKLPYYFGLEQTCTAHSTHAQHTVGVKGTPPGHLAGVRRRQCRRRAHRPLWEQRHVREVAGDPPVHEPGTARRACMQRTHQRQHCGGRGWHSALAPLALV